LWKLLAARFAKARKSGEEKAYEAVGIYKW
jgi:hypothetical protein